MKPKLNEKYYYFLIFKIEKNFKLRKINFFDNKLLKLMGAACSCGQESMDIVAFWRGLELRKITFEKFCKLLETNQGNWLNSGGENRRTIDLKNCEELKGLLINNELSEIEKNVFFEKLQIFVNRQHDKLTFFTCLAFFTQLYEDRSSADKKPTPNQTYIQAIKNKEKEKSVDKIYETLLRLAIKKNDHDDVTKLFIELVTEIPVLIVHSSKKDIEEKNIIYSKANRDRLFAQLKSMSQNKFYEYMFNKDNISLIHNDLVKINSGNHVKEDLAKIKSTSNNINISNTANRK